MTRYGYFLSCAEYGPGELVRQARLAEEADFGALWISDHYHPWLDEQGQSGFVWSVIGAVSQATSLPVTTAVTCPLVRQHCRSWRFPTLQKRGSGWSGRKWGGHRPGGWWG
jgi:hypothetical protein